jgi:hypothetical protein
VLTKHACRLTPLYLTLTQWWWQSWWHAHLSFKLLTLIPPPLCPNPAVTHTTAQAPRRPEWWGGPGASRRPPAVCRGGGTEWRLQPEFFAGIQVLSLWKSSALNFSQTPSATSCEWSEHAPSPPLITLSLPVSTLLLYYQVSLIFVMLCLC